MKKYMKYRSGFMKSGGRVGGSSFSKRVVGTPVNFPKVRKVAPFLAAGYMAGVMRSGGSKYGRYSTRSVDTFKGEGDLSVKVPRGISSPRNALSTATIYGNYGSITRSRYTEGTYYIPSFIAQQAKQARYGYDTQAIFVSSAAQNTGLLTFNTGNVITQILQNLQRVDTLTAGETPSIEGYLQYCQSETRITNSSNTGCVVEIYEIVPKRDFVGGATGVGTPIIAWTVGLTSSVPYNSMTMSGMSPVNYYSSPTDSPIFTQFYSIKKRFKIEMPAGACHIHTSFYNVNKNIPQAMFASTGYASADSQLVNMSKNIMFVVRGTPAFSNATPSTVSTAPSGVDIVSSNKIVAYAIPNSNTVIGFSGSGLQPLADPRQYVVDTVKNTTTNT